jgi:hypothetical protein
MIWGQGDGSSLCAVRLSTASLIDLKTRARELRAPFFGLTMFPISEIGYGQDRDARSHRP